MTDTPAAEPDGLPKPYVRVLAQAFNGRDLIAYSWRAVPAAEYLSPSRHDVIARHLREVADLAMQKHATALDPEGCAECVNGLGHPDAASMRLLNAAAYAEQPDETSWREQVEELVRGGMLALRYGLKRHPGRVVQVLLPRGVTEQEASDAIDLCRRLGIIRPPRESFHVISHEDTPSLGAAPGVRHIDDLVERWVCENHPDIGWAGECCDPAGWNAEQRCPHGLCGCGAGHGVEREVTGA